MDQDNQQNFDDQSDDQTVSNNNLVAPPAAPSTPPAIQLSNLPDDLNSVIGHNGMPAQAVSDPTVPTGVAQPPATNINQNQTPLAAPAVAPSPSETPVATPPQTDFVQPPASQPSLNASFLKGNIFSLLGLSFGVISPLIFFLLSSARAIALILAIAGLLLSIFDFSPSKKKIALIGIILNALMIVGVIVFLILNTRSTSKIVNPTDTETASDVSTEQTTDSLDSSDDSQIDSTSTSDQSSDTSTSTTGNSSSSRTTTQSATTGLTSGTITTTLESKPYASTKGGFEITPPSGWTVDESGTGGSLVIFKNPNSDKIGSSSFNASISVISPSSIGSTDLTGFVTTIKNKDTQSLSSFKIAEDANSDLGYYMGGTYTQGSFQLRNLHLLGVYNNYGYNIVCTATAANWDKYSDLCKKSFLTYALTS